MIVYERKAISRESIAWLLREGRQKSEKGKDIYIVKKASIVQ